MLKSYEIKEWRRVQTDEGEAAGQNQGVRENFRSCSDSLPHSVVMGCSIHSLLIDAAYCYQDCRPTRKSGENRPVMKMAVLG